MSETTETLSEKYKPQAKRKSQWDSRLMFGLLVIILFGGIISISLNVLLFRVAITRLFKSQRLMQRVTRLLKTDNISATHETFIGKRTCITMAATVVTFAIVLAIIRLAADQNFLIMACNLLVEYAWLLGVILISLLIRLSTKQIKSGFRIYAPLIVIDFIIIENSYSS